MKDKNIIAIIVFVGIVFYALTLRGSIGNGTPKEVMSGKLHKSTGALELSPERARFAHVVNLAERGEYDLTKEWADIVYPDVGTANGKFYSFFAPGVSYMSLPLYLLGSNYGLGQVGAFSTESILAIITLIFLYKIARNIFNLSKSAAFFSVLVFAFGSTYWSYAVTLYQHTFSIFFIVTAVYAAWSFKMKQGEKWSWLYALYVWAAFALAITVDYPNVITFLPIMVYLAYNSISFHKVQEGLSFSIRWSAVVTALVFTVITGLHLWHNAHYYGSPLQTAGGLADYVKPVTVATSTVVKRVPFALLSTATSTATTTGTIAATTTATTTKDVVDFFSEENLPTSLYILLISPDRGLFVFCPIFILALWGIYLSRKKLTIEHYLLFFLVGANIFLYGSWGDPWGGWAYGPRYLTLSMAFLAIFVGVALDGEVAGQLRSKSEDFFTRLGIFILFMYSSAIALLGAITTNAVPPKSEAVLLPIKKYNFLLNIDYLRFDQSSSFFYNTVAGKILTLFGYFTFVYLALLLIVGIVLFLPTVIRFIKPHRHE